MNKIKKAIELEKRYIKDREVGVETFSFSDEIKKLGFDSLESFYQKKKFYLLKQVKFELIEVHPFTADDEMMKVIQTGINALLFLNTDRTIVYTGSSETFNRKYCEENNIPIVSYMAHGGTLVASPGEFSFGVVMPNDLEITRTDMMLKLKEILDKYMGGVTMDNNDIMVDGKKVCGTTLERVRTKLIFIAQISFDDKSELIRKICYEPKTGKEPGFITKMTREQMRQEVLEWLL